MNKPVSAKLGWHVDTLQKVIITAVRAVAPVWRTALISTILRDTGLPSAQVALERVRLNFILRLRTVDEQHLLTRRVRL